MGSRMNRGGYKLGPRSKAHRRNLRKSLIGRKILWSDKISRTVKDLWQRGFYKNSKHNKNSDVKISRSVKNLWKVSEYRDHMIKAHTGFVASEETKKKMSIAHKGKHTGKNSHFWRGGISFEPYSPLFNKHIKERVRVRDNFICQVCGIPELECYKKHVVHHVDYNKKNSKLSNLTTLCNSCHVKTNFNRKYWREHFKEKLICQTS